MKEDSHMKQSVLLVLIVCTHVGLLKVVYVRSSGFEAADGFANFLRNQIAQSSMPLRWLVRCHPVGRTGEAAIYFWLPFCTRKAIKAFLQPYNTTTPPKVSVVF